jgi:hypothetical protein
VDHHGLTCFSRLRETLDCLLGAFHEKCIVQMIEARPQEPHCLFGVAMLPDYQEIGNFLRNR